MYGKMMKILEGLIPQYFKSIETHMDFAGQKKAETTFQIIIVLFAAVGFVWGYICQQFSQTIYITSAGFVLACLLTLPPWPMYRGNPITWQKPRPDPKSETSQTTEKTQKKK